MTARLHVVTDAPRAPRPCPAVSLNTTESAQIMLELVRANIDDETRAIDYLERATMMLIQELRLARKTRRGRR